MRIHVTAEDIAEGMPGEMCACPIARAVGRAIAEDTTHDGITTDPVWRELPKVFVGVHGITVHDLGWTLTPRYAELPIRAYSFIKAYDDGQHVEPLEFEIELVSLEEFLAAREA